MGFWLVTFALLLLAFWIAVFRIWYLVKRGGYRLPCTDDDRLR